MKTCRNARGCLKNPRNDDVLEPEAAINYLGGFCYVSVSFPHGGGTPTGMLYRLPRPDRSSSLPLRYAIIRISRRRG
jgi:hypothetical protein